MRGGENRENCWGTISGGENSGVNRNYENMGKRVMVSMRTEDRINED